MVTPLYRSCHQRVLQHQLRNDDVNQFCAQEQVVPGSPLGAPRNEPLRALEVFSPVVTGLRSSSGCLLGFATTELRPERYKSRTVQ